MIIKLTSTETSPEVLNLTKPSRPEVVILLRTTVTFLPATVFPVFIGVAVAMGAYLNSPAKEYVNDFSSPAVIVPLLTTRTYPPITLASVAFIFCFPAFGVSIDVYLYVDGEIAV